MDDKRQIAFMQAYRKCHEPFMRYCSAIAYGTMDVQDLAQEVLLSTYKNFDRIDPDKELLHYMIRAARNRKISRWRKKKKYVELKETHTERLLSREIATETILEIQDLYSALNQLPVSQRDALILFELSGFSVKEVAQLQNSTEGAIKTKLSRGRVKLKDILLDLNRTPDPIISTLKSILL